MRRHLPGQALPFLLALAACRPGAGGDAAATGAIRLDAVMADPRDVADERGEWIRLRNVGATPVQLRGWTIASGGDAPHRVAGDVVVPAGGTVTIARAAGARGEGAAPAYVYGSGIALANRDDWVALHDASGHAIDSVAWSAARVRDSLVAKSQGPGELNGSVTLK